MARCQRSTTPPFVSPSSRAEYDAILHIWSDGNQAQVEDRLVAACAKFPYDQRLFFFRAVCMRSEFSIVGRMPETEATPLLSSLARSGKRNRQTYASKLALELDQFQNVPDNFNNLGRLALETAPRDPLLIWLFAIEGRTQSQPKAAAKAYEALFKMVRRGGPLMHQTYANVLDSLGRYNDALPHRREALALWPGWWSHDGLALTLEKLNRHHEAEKKFKENLRLYPNHPLVWLHWGDFLFGRNRFPEAEAIFKRVIQLDPLLSSGWADLGILLRYTNRSQKSLPYLRRALQLDPRNSPSRRQAVLALQKLGRAKDAREVANGALPPER